MYSMFQELKHHVFGFLYLKVSLNTLSWRCYHASQSCNFLQNM